MTNPSFELPAVSAVFADSDTGASIPIYLLRSASDIEIISDLSAQQQAWIESCQFKATRRTHLLLPDSEGKISKVLFGVGSNGEAEPCGPSEFLLGDLANKLPEGSYQIGAGFADKEAAAIAWGLGAYKFSRYKSNAKGQPPNLQSGE